jgi:hypothetical protein
MKLLALAVLLTTVTVAHAETFDIATFTPPAQWQPQNASGTVAYTTTDQKAGTFCRLQLMASVPSTGSAASDFATDWKGLVVASLAPTSAPRTEPPRSADGWDTIVGGAPFKSSQRDGLALLIVMTGHGKRFSILYSATGDCSAQFDPFVRSLTLASPTPTPAAPAQGGATTTSGEWKLEGGSEYVEARRDAFTVRLHFALAMTDDLRRDPEAKRDHFWNTLVAPRYTQITNVRKPRIEAYATSEMMEADMIETRTRQRVHVAFHMFTSNGIVSSVEVVAPTKAVLDATYADATKVDALRALNRFPLTTKDVTGSWADSTSAFAEYFNIYTGNSAGVGISAASYTVAFAAKGTFASKVKAVTGMAGRVRFAQENRAGTWSLADAWTLVTQDGPVRKRYSGWFEQVKGGRMLHLVEADKSGMHDVLFRQK